VLADLKVDPAEGRYIYVVINSSKIVFWQYDLPERLENVRQQT